MTKSRRTMRRGLTSGHSFVPVQLFAQGVEVAPALGVQKPHVVLGPGDDDAVAMQQRRQDCMSKLALASRPATISMAMLGSASTMGRLDKVWGAIGTSTQPGMDGCSKGPPADKA
jgi:hypothetical protein